MTGLPCVKGREIVEHLKKQASPLSGPVEAMFSSNTRMAERLLSLCAPWKR
jgi:hypothetical protein